MTKFSIWVALAAQIGLVVVVLRSGATWPDYALAAFTVGLNAWFWARHFWWPPKAAPLPPPRGPFQISAYLVVTLNTRASPPFVSRVEIFSVSAQDLTITGSGQAHLDLYQVRGDNFRKARNLILRDAPRVWPWIVPFLREVPGNE